MVNLTTLAPDIAAAILDESLQGRRCCARSSGGRLRGRW